MRVTDEIPQGSSNRTDPGDELSRLHRALEAAAQGVWEYDPASGRVTLTGGAAILSRESGTIGTYDDFLTCLHPEDRERFHVGFQRAQEPDSGGTHRVECRIVWPDGTVRFVLAAGQVFFAGGNGGRRAIRYTGILADVTERAEAEQALRQSQADFNRAQAVAHSGNWRMDVRHNDLRWSDEVYRIFGLPIGMTLTYETFLAVVHPDDRAYVDQKWRAAVRGEPYDIDHRILVDGAVRWVRERAELEFDTQGRLLGGFGIAQDITDRKRAEEEARQAREIAEDASRAKAEFLANMSHEIRTPMTVILGSLEHLSQTGLPEAQRPLVEMAEDAAERLLNLLNDILDVSRIESRRLEIAAEPFDLRACVEKSVRFFELKAKEKGLQLQVIISPELPTVVSGDAARLGQILLNLVGNAVKFTPRGEVSVVVDAAPEQANCIRFSVRDTGIGIPAEKLGGLFESFSQVDASRTRKYGGTGLGLAISKGLTELMGGTIAVESVEGGGSTFSFRLPLVPAGTAQPGPETTLSPSTAVGPEKQVRILLAEDDPMVRELVGIILRRRNWEVVPVPCGRTAVAAWETGKFDVILMDVQMPGMDGLEATRIIRERETGCGTHTRIIALTAHARREDEEMCRAAGMDGYLTKPIDTGRLYALVEAK